MESEEILAEKIRKGDAEAYEHVFKTWYAPLCRYGWTILKDKEEAEDVVQQVFISLWEKRETLEVKVSLKSLLYKYVYNAGLNRVQQKKVRSNYAKEAQVVQLNYTEAEKKLEEKELSNKIEKSIDGLPEQCAKIFRMSRFQHLKYQEIADQMGLSVKTVENQMGKALKLLRENLKEYLPFVLFFIFLQK